MQGWFNICKSVNAHHINRMKDKHIISREREAGKNRHPVWKGRSKIVFADNMILYTENPKDLTKKTKTKIKNKNKTVRTNKRTQ